MPYTELNIPRSSRCGRLKLSYVWIDLRYYLELLVEHNQFSVDTIICRYASGLLARHDY